MAGPIWQDRQHHTEALIQAALAAVEPGQAVRRILGIENKTVTIGSHEFQLEGGSRVYVVGAGKAGVAMGRASQDILGDRLRQGILAVPTVPSDASGAIHWIEGGHPLPTEGSIQAGRAIADCLNSTRQEDLVLALISGGGSALLELPVEGISLDDMQRTTELLLQSGASIHELNSLRHQLSLIKGGGLARMAAPATLVALILSDVVGDRLDIIASGPTVPPESTAAGAMDVINRYDLADRLPATVVARVRQALSSPRGVMPVSKHVLIGNNRTAANAVIEKARGLGFRSLLLTNYLEGEAAQAGIFVAALAKSIRSAGDPIAAPACLVLGGETTVNVTGDGVGGRNQELALAAALALDGWDRSVMVTLATDGVDGPTPAAGAIITGETAELGRQAGHNPEAHLRANDSHTFHSAVKSALQLGSTGTNVNDLVILLVY